MKTEPSAEMDELHELRLVHQDPVTAEQKTSLNDGAEDRKLALLARYFKAAIDRPDIVMWFVMPGGFIKGTPISPNEYYARMKSKKTEVAEMDRESGDRFFHLDEAVIVLGEGTKKLQLGLIVLDGLQISAWGYARRNKRMVFKNL